MQGGNFFSKDKIDLIRNNIRKFDKIKKLSQESIYLADALLEQGKNYWWTKATPNEIPRCLTPGHDNSGCPNCGDDFLIKYGTMGWTVHSDKNKWKVECPNCGSVYPTNDFKSYYESGLDDTGIFRKKLADNKFLINISNPDKGKDWFVDDGSGYVDTEGTRWSFIAYYNHFATWLDLYNKAGINDRSISAAVMHLADAYVYTGDITYAKYCILILYKVALLYPSMDLNVWMRLPGRPYRNTDGFSLQGKTIGCIWETYVARMLCYAADAVLPVINENGYEIKEFFSEFIKIDVKDIYDTIINGIVREVYPSIKNGSIAGNEGMHQSALAMAIVCMGECKEAQEWLEFLFAHGGRKFEKDPIRVQKTYYTGCNILGILENKVNGDGFGNECSPMYNRLWLVEFDRIADILSNYPGIKNTKYDIRKHPVMKKMYQSYTKLNLDNIHVPKNGDVGKTGDPFRVFAEDNMQKEDHLQRVLINGYNATKDPKILDYFNVCFPMAHKGDFGYVDCKEFEIIISLLNSSKDPKESLHTVSHNLTDYGNALLRQKERFGCNMHMYYGSTAGHGHSDKMNFEIIANGINCTPDLGYPEFAEKFPKRKEWTSHTISHNTVMVDETCQEQTLFSGIPKGFEDRCFLKYIDVDDPNTYNSVSMYRRSMCMINIAPGKAYFVDFFRVAGGSTHHFSFHGGEGEISYYGCDMKHQASGTYQGENVVFGERKDREKGGYGNGFHYLYDVLKSDEPCQYFELEYKLKDTWDIRKGKTGQPYIKAYMLGETNQRVIAKGQPPVNKIGNPKFLYYYLGKRQGNDLKSRYVSVYEPYLDNNEICSVELININGKSDNYKYGCVKVTLKDGTIDYIIHSIDETVTIDIDNEISFKGQLGFIRIKDCKVLHALVSKGTLLVYKDIILVNKTNPYIHGYVIDFQKEISEDNFIDIFIENEYVPFNDLIGRFINIEGNNVGNASYQILDINKLQSSNNYRIKVGETSIRGYVDLTNPCKGYIYRFSEGAAFEIPLCYTN